MIAGKQVPPGAHLTHEIPNFTRTFASLVKLHDFSIIGGKAAAGVAPSLATQPVPVTHVPSPRAANVMPPATA
jgi:hypothetical protein